MGWAARVNPRVDEIRRTRRLRELCKLVPRDIIEAQLSKLSESDQRIVLKMLDDTQPIAHV